MKKHKTGTAVFQNILREIEKVNDFLEIGMVIEAAARRKDFIMKIEGKALKALSRASKRPKKVTKKLRADDKRNSPKFHAHLRRLAEARKIKAEMDRKAKRLEEKAHQWADEGYKRQEADRRRIKKAMKTKEETLTGKIIK